MVSPRQTIPEDGKSGDIGNRIIGFWWSDADFQWWPYYLWEAREATGQPDLSPEQAFDYATANGFPLRRSIPLGKGRPDNEDYTQPGSGRPAPSGGGRGGGGGGGAIGPVYVAPDEGAVREQIKAYVVATTGTLNDGIIDAALKSYVSEFRRGFDLRDSEEVDPWVAVRDIVRKSDAYKSLHELRPESVDEMDWVTGRQGKLRQLGLSAQRAEEVGIELSAAGATDQDLALGGTIASSVGTGRQLETMRNKIKNAAMAAGGVV